MNLQKRDCPIKFEIKSCSLGWLNVSLHIGKDIHDISISYIGNGINALLESLVYLHPDYNEHGRESQYMEYKKVEIDGKEYYIPYIAKFDWNEEGSEVSWKIAKYPDNKDNFSVMVDLNIIRQTNGGVFKYKVDYRDLCYATADLCTNLLKNLGFNGYFNSYWQKNINIYDLLFVKAYALKAMYLLNLKYSDKYSWYSDINKELELLLFDMDKKKNFPKHYDNIDVEIIPEKDYKKASYYYSGARANIIINGRSFLEIITEREEKIFSSEGFKKYRRTIPKAGDYNYLTVSELFSWLEDAAKSNGEDEAYIFSCGGCDEAGCWSVLVDIVYTNDSVIWKNFRSVGEDYKFDLQYEFKISQYKCFMNKLKEASSEQ
ncbi:MAG: hypothetical protein J5896_06450 [Alphaproteobacteria bacterium]|nr:hypothetical protein [Alphaproteobacteria bacterium]